MTSDRLVTYDRSKLAILIGLNINIIKYTFPIFFSNLSENVTRGSFVTWQSFHDSVQFRDLTKLFRDSWLFYDFRPFYDSESFEASNSYWHNGKYSEVYDVSIFFSSLTENVQK